MAFMDNRELSQVSSTDLIKSCMNNTGELKDLEGVSERWDMLERVMILNDIDEIVSDAIAHLIRFWNQVDKGVPISERKPIKLYIDSCGGSLVGALTIADSIRMSKTPVYTINMGAAYSGGLLVFIAGHKRFGYKSCSFLFHEGSTTIGNVDAGKFRNYASYYEKLIQRMKGYILNYTKITEEEYKEIRNDDYWFFIEEAIEKGICDEILEEFI